MRSHVNAPSLLGVPSGEPHEGVLEIRRIELDVMCGDAGRGQGEDHRVDEFPGPGDDDVLALALDPAYLGKVRQHPLVERCRGHEPHALPAPGLRGQAGRGVQRGDAPAVDERHAVAQPLGFLHEVRHQEDRHAALAHALDQVPGVAAGLRVQARRHLVEHRDLRLADERQRDRKPLPLPAGQGLVVVPELAGQSEHLGQLADVGRLAVNERYMSRISPTLSWPAARSPGVAPRRSRGPRPGRLAGPGPAAGRPGVR